MPSAMLDREPLKVLVTTWLAKIRIAMKEKQRLFGDDADEAMLFFNGPANWMFQMKYARNRDNGYLRAPEGDDNSEEILPPAFQMCVNKVAELRDLMGPTMYAQNPTITVEPNDPPPVPPQALGVDPTPPQPPPGWNPAIPLPPTPQQQQFMQLMQQQQTQTGLNDFKSDLLQYFLNYIQRETDKKTNARHVIDEGIIKGLGLFWHEVVERPGFRSRIVGSFYDTVDNLVLDPDAESWDNVWWTARKCVHPHWQVEDDYGLPRGTLKGKGSWSSYDKMAGEREDKDRHRDGRSNDMVIYWKIYSKMGMGELLAGSGKHDTDTDSNVPKELRHAFDELGPNVLVVVCQGVPWPLNLPPHLWTDDPQDDLLEGSEPEERERTDDTAQDSADDAFEMPLQPKIDPQSGEPVVDPETGDAALEITQAAFEACQWPIPLWADGGWMFTPLSYRWVPNQVWPMPMIKPGIGYLRFINWAMSFLAVKVRKACITTIGVLKAAGEDVKEQLLNGKDFNVIELQEVTGKRIEELVSVLQYPEFNDEIWKVIAAVMDKFAEATGLNELIYGQTAHQSRSAADAQSKQQNTLLRPDDMANMTEDALSKVAAREGMASRWLLGAEDVQPILGQMGAQAWQNLVQSADVEQVAREFTYRVEAGSARKPNKDTRIQQANEAGQSWGPLFTQYFMKTGDAGPVDALIQFWAKANDVKMPTLQSAPPPPPPGAPQGPGAAAGHPQPAPPHPKPQPGAPQSRPAPPPMPPHPVGAA